MYTYKRARGFCRASGSQEAISCRRTTRILETNRLVSFSLFLSLSFRRLERMYARTLIRTIGYSEMKCPTRDTKLIRNVQFDFPTRVVRRAYHAATYRRWEEGTLLRQTERRALIVYTGEGRFSYIRFLLAPIDIFFHTIKLFSSLIVYFTLFV